MTFDSKEDYLKAFQLELESRGERALSTSAVRRALDDADDRFDQLLGRGRTPRAVSEALGDPGERAEVVIATRLLRLRPGTSAGPELASYLRVIRALWIAAPVNLILAIVPPLLVLAAVCIGFIGCATLLLSALLTLATFVLSGGGTSLTESAAGVFHLIAVASGSVFAACLITVVFDFLLLLIWRWSRWNVGFLMEEPT